MRKNSFFENRNGIIVTSDSLISTTESDKPPIRKTRLPRTLAILSHLQNLTTNAFFYLKFLALYDLASDVGESIASPIILTFMTGTTVTFLTSILPAAVEHNYHSNGKINHFIKICKKVLSFEIRTLSLEANDDKYQIPFFIDVKAVKTKLNINDSDFEYIKDTIVQIIPPFKDHVEIIWIENSDALHSSHLYGYHNNEPVNLLYYGEEPQNIGSNLKPISITDIDSGILKRIYFERLPILNTFLSSILSVNHVAERCFGNSEKYSRGALWTLEISALCLAIPKTFTSFKRKFSKAREAWEYLLYFLFHGKSHFIIRNRRKFFLDVILTGISAACTFTANSFFFMHNGAMEQLMEIACQLTNECSYEFDTFHPNIPQWQYYIAYVLMFVALGTVTFTQIPSSISQYVRETTPKPENESDSPSPIPHSPQIDHPTAWQFAKWGIRIDATQMATTIFLGSTAAIAYFSHESIKDPVPISAGVLFAFLSTRSYLHFQKLFGEEKFNKTCETITQAWQSLKNNVSHWCSFLHSPSQTPLLTSKNSYRSLDFEEASAANLEPC